MITKLMNLDPEKRDRIIIAAMKEFAEKGYEKASTNEIVNGAQISKGLLFHYFKNKKQLYMFLYDYGLEFMTNEFYKRVNMEERDLFEKIRDSGLAKLEIMKKNPHLLPFLQGTYLETSIEIRAELEAKGKKILEVNMQKTFDNVDTSRFRPGLDLQTAIGIITWSTEGLVSNELRKYRMLGKEIDYDAVFALANHYMDVLKDSFYKKPD